MSAQHTPGPWMVGVGPHPMGSEPLQFCVGTTDGTIVAKCGVILDDDKERRERTIRDVALISTAPDLLDLALRYASECGECAGTRVCPDGEPCAECAFIWTVIDQARGGKIAP